MCDCISKVNEMLVEKGIRLERMFTLGAGSLGESLVLHTTKLDTDRPTKLKIFPSYCPFCGEKYEAGPHERTPPPSVDLACRAGRMV